MQAALHDHNVLAVIGKGQVAAVGYKALRGTGILREQARREINALNAREAQLLQGVQAVAAAAEEFDDGGVFGPRWRAEFLEAGNKFVNFLRGSFKACVGGFPRINCRWRDI